VTTPQLLEAVMARRLEPAALITHRFRLVDMDPAYDTFGRAADRHAVKVIAVPRKPALTSLGTYLM